MFELRHQPLLPMPAFYARMARSIALAGLLVAAALLIGILGYRILENLPWIDALLNASMILGGMGPVAILQTTAGKLFASFYALFSGLVFVATAGIVFLPVIHRLLHHFHLDSK